MLAVLKPFQNKSAEKHRIAKPALRQCPELPPSQSYPSITNAAFGAVLNEIVFVVHQALFPLPRLAPLYVIGPRVLSIVSWHVTD